MNTAVSAIVAIVATLGTAGIVNAIGFSTPVHAQATHFQGGTCTGPDKSCASGVITPSGNTNLQSPSHGTGFTPQGPGAAVTPTTCGNLPTPTCFGSVFTPSGNENNHQHNTTSTP